MTACNWIKAELREVESPRLGFLGTKGRFLTSQYGERGRQGQRWSCDGGSALKELGLVPGLELNLRPVCPKIHLRPAAAATEGLGPNLGTLPEGTTAPPLICFCASYT
jgi:hypothetical protein